MNGLERDTVFVALTRPQIFAGVTYTWFVANAVIATELFRIFRSAWVVSLALTLHGVGVLACLREPRFFDLWLTRIGRCPRVRSFGAGTIGSYALNMLAHAWDGADLRNVTGQRRTAIGPVADWRLPGRISLKQTLKLEYLVYAERA